MEAARRLQTRVNVVDPLVLVARRGISEAQRHAQAVRAARRLHASSHFDVVTSRPNAAQKSVSLTTGIP